jgi:hypothetical protein
MKRLPSGAPAFGFSFSLSRTAAPINFTEQARVCSVPINLLQAIYEVSHVEHWPFLKPNLMFQKVCERNLSQLSWCFNTRNYALSWKYALSRSGAVVTWPVMGLNSLADKQNDAASIFSPGDGGSMLL